MPGLPLLTPWVGVARKQKRGGQGLCTPTRFRGLPNTLLEHSLFNLPYGPRDRLCHSIIIVIVACAGPRLPVYGAVGKFLNLAALAVTGGHHHQGLGEREQARAVCPSKKFSTGSKFPAGMQLK